VRETVKLFLGQAVFDVAQVFIHAEEKDDDLAINSNCDRSQNNHQQTAQENAYATGIGTKTGAHRDQASDHADGDANPEDHLNDSRGDHFAKLEKVFHFYLQKI